MEELTELKSSETILVPPDEVIKLQLLQMAIDSRSVDPLGFAKEMYNWVKECWIVKDKGVSEITIEKNGETITIPLREFEVHA